MDARSARRFATMGQGSETQTYRFGIYPVGPDGEYSPDAIGLPKIPEREFGRVVVLLGANGAGKSRLLRLLKLNPKVNDKVRDVVYVEGGRSLAAGPSGPPGKGKYQQ